MPLNTKQNKSTYTGKKKELPEIKAGTYTGRIALVADVGIQPQKDWQTGEEQPAKEIIHVVVEFPKIRLDVDGEDKPRWIGKQFKVVNKYNADGSYNEYYENSGMFKIIEPLMTGEDVGSIINSQVICQIGHTKSGNPKIVTMGAVPEGLEVPELENPQVVFDFYNPDADEFNKLPKWMQKVCLEAEDYETSNLKNVLELTGYFDED